MWKWTVGPFQLFPLGRDGDSAVQGTHSDAGCALAFSMQLPVRETNRHVLFLCASQGYRGAGVQCVEGIYGDEQHHVWWADSHIQVRSSAVTF